MRARSNFSVNDLYRAACMLHSTGKPSDVAVAHMCVLRINELTNSDAVGDSSPLDPEYRENFPRIAIDSWYYFWNSAPPPTTE